MRFAYADPPYFGCGASHYGSLHPAAADWDDRQAHLDLIARLVNDYPDGWVLSLNPRDLSWQLPACPDDVRVGAWCKTYHQIRPSAVQYAWEPVIFRGGRVIKGRNPLVRDWFVGNADRGNALRKHVPGSKPQAFNRWVLDLLGHQDGDVLDDLFPGAGGMAQTLAAPPLNFTKETA
jgi:hypothetical protein